MKINSNVRTWLIVSAVIAVVVLILWLSDNYIDPPVKATISISAGKITIQNLNRIDWENPEFVLDDGAELKLAGSWPSRVERTFDLSEFRNPQTGLPHEESAKKGFQMTVFMSGFTTTLLYDWKLE
jgi:hypothetical protein